MRKWLISEGYLIIILHIHEKQNVAIRENVCKMYTFFLK